MPNVLPGARWEPINHSGRPLRRKGRGACAHVAVSESANLRPWNSNDWHFYLPRTGPAIQYVDMDYVASCQRDGNSTLVSWESQGGVHGSETERWSDNQIEWGARIYAHLHKTEGAPLQLMPNSLSTSRGLGYHRLGVDPWRVAGGELWSSAYGKTCPGAAKIAQIPQILTRAKQIVAGGIDQEEAELMALLNDTDRTLLAQYGGSLIETIADRARIRMRDIGADERTSRLALSLKRIEAVLAAQSSGDTTPDDLAALAPVIAQAVVEAFQPHLDGMTVDVDYARLTAEMQEAVRLVLRSV